MSIEGKTIVFTGKLQSKRADMVEQAEGAGAKVGKSVTKTTDILVCGADVGAKKTSDAEAKGVEVWTEQQFLDALGSGGSGKKAKGGKKRAADAEPAKDPSEETYEEKMARLMAAKEAKKKPAAKKAKKEEPPEEEEEEDDEEPAPKGKKAATKKTIAKKPAAKKAAAKKPAAKKAKGAAKEEAEEAEEAEPAPVPAPSPAKSTGGVGQRAVDREVPNGGAYTVFGEFDTKLMQSNIGSNNNKFYIIQVLQGPGGFAAWNRWGRLGESGQNSIKQGLSQGEAVKLFEKKFKDKTKNSWGDRDSFVKYTGKYQLVEMDEKDDGAAGGDAALGKLSEAQIMKGQAVLKKLRAAVEGGKGDFVGLSSEYYSLIPTVAGRQAPPPLNNMAIVTQKEGLLEFWLRMGFEEVSTELMDDPLEGLNALPVPSSLKQCALTISDSSSINAAETRGAVLSKDKVATPARTMGPEKYASVLLYTGNSIYRALNQALRVEHFKVKKYFPYLRLLLESMNCMKKQSGTLWRGIAADLYDEYEPGKIITWWSVSSCTSDQNVARNFMSQLGGGATFITLNVKKAIDISPLSFYAHEKESLLAPGTRLKVLDRKRNGRVAEIEVEEVDSVLN